MNPQTIRLVSLWESVGRPSTFEAWQAAYLKLEKVYANSNLARELGAGWPELKEYEDRARELERLVYPSECAA